jgi:putative RNA 2'-phosphotransferase
LLRHEVEQMSLKRDERGFVPLDELLPLIQQSGHCRPILSRDELEEYLRKQSDRFEIEQDQVRARYGHSLDGYTPGSANAPPPRLYHGTSQRLFLSIESAGLRPMGRLFVHLTSDVAYARTIAVGVEGDPLILRVDAERAHRLGARFYQANRHVWLTGAITPEFLQVDTEALVGQDADQRDKRLAAFFGESPAAELSLPLPWYHVCSVCNAKWFAQRAQDECPRCAQLHRSQEQQAPPWSRRGTSPG